MKGLMVRRRFGTVDGRVRGLARFRGAKVWLAAAALTASALVLCGGCRKTVAESKEAGRSGSVASLTTADEEEAPAPRELPAPVAFADRLVGEGELKGAGLLLEFHMQRIEGDTNLTYDEAVDHCRAHGRMLCSSAQWVLACRQFGELAQMQTWVLSRRRGKAEVMGGEFCSDRDQADDAQRHSNRVGLCCERSVALVAGTDMSKQGPWVGMAARLPRVLEAALNAGDEATLRKLYAPRVEVDERLLSIDELLSREKQAREEVAWTVFDRCAFSTRFVKAAQPQGNVRNVRGFALRCSVVAKIQGAVRDYLVMFGMPRPSDPSSTNAEDYRITQVTHRTSMAVPGAR